MTVQNTLDAAFERTHRDGRSALIPYMTGGFPNPEGFVDLALGVLDAGGDALEIGIPFSDPLLDGPSIQQSQQQALERGVTPAACLDLARQVHERSDKPLLLMGAFNPVLAYGVERFCRDAASAGVSALIIPDVPLEEQEPLRAAAETNGLHLIQMVAPTSTGERLRRVCAAASGFVYCVSVTGVTGVRRGVAESAKPLVEAVRACTKLPVAVGFGISGPDQAREVAAFADAVIVGSALVNTIAAAPRETQAEAARTFVSELRSSLEASAVR